MAVMALLLNLSKAAVTDYANGLGGNAPCVESFVGVWESADVGYDPHATQGIQANDGSFAAVAPSRSCLLFRLVRIRSSKCVLSRFPSIF